MNKEETLKKAVSLIDELFRQLDTRSVNSDIMGDIFEYLLEEVKESGKNGQFRTPRHVIRFMVQLLKPELGKSILDPACGSGGFLLNSLLHWKAEHTDSEVLRLEWDGSPHDVRPVWPLGWKPDFNNSLHGYDNDRTMVRIAWMNLILHDLDAPEVHQRDALSKRLSDEESGTYDYILANPPFTGSVDMGDLSVNRTRFPNLENGKPANKSELLFVWLMIDLLKKGGRAAVIVPDGVLFGGTNAHGALRRQLLFKNIHHLRAEADAKTATLVPAIFEGFFGDPVRNPKKWDIEPLAAVINGTPKNGLYKPAEMYGEGTPIIRIGDFNSGILRTSKNLQRLRIADDEIGQFGVSNGQILINRVNSIEHLGKSLLVASLTEPTVYESNMMRLDPKKEKVLPEFLIACLQHESLVAKLRAKAKKAINQASINQTDVLTLSIPLPPLSKQEAFVSEVSQAEEIRLLAETSLRIERTVSASLSAHAFSGQLTADWREGHGDKMALEARERDDALKQVGATFTRSRRATIQETDRVFEQRTDGIYSELNREQRDLLYRIQQLVGGVDYARYFSAQSLSQSVDGSLRRNPQAVEGHLAVFAACGLIIPVSREEQTEDTGEFSFGNAYRLPLGDRKSIYADATDQTYVNADGDAYSGIERPGDHTRLRELERIVAQLEAESALK